MRRAVIILVLVIFGRGAGGGAPLAAETAIEIRGEYEQRDYDPRTEMEKEYLDQGFRAEFTVLVEGKSRRIEARITNPPTWRDIYSVGDWFRITYSGGNLYYEVPDLLAQFPASYTGSRDIPAAARVSSGPILYPRNSTYMEAHAALWLAFLSPKALSEVEIDKNTYDMPLPWNGTFKAFGYRMEAASAAGGRFVRECRFVRDSSLDRDSIQAELFRHLREYPKSVKEMNRIQERIRRRGGISDGWVAGRYEVRRWMEGKGQRVPKKAQLRTYLAPPNGQGVATLGIVEVKSVKVKEIDEELLEPPEVPTLVQDYRYKEKANKRIFPYGEYVLQPGEEWRGAADPELLAKKEEYLESGPKYNQFASQTNYLLWAGLAIVLAPFGTYMYLRYRKRGGDHA